MIIETVSLISIGKWLGNKLLNKGFDSLFSKISSSNYNDKFYKIVNQVSFELQKKYPDALGGNIEYFFKHDDVFNELIKLLFINSKVDLKVIEEKFDIKTLPDNFILEFIQLLRVELFNDKDFNLILSNKEIYLISVGIDTKVEDVLKISSLSYDEIIILKNLIESKYKSDFSLTNFLNEYKNSLINNYSQLNFIGLGLDLSVKKGKRKKLEDLYVKPTFSVDDANFKILQKINPNIIADDPISLDEIFNFDRNLIILGNPGSGKSIFTKFVSLKIIQSDKSIFENNTIIESIPFRIELRKYHAFKKEQNEGLIKYLRFLLENEFDFPNILTEDVQQILLKKNSIVIFDGLDEIFNLNDKLLIKNDIENFISKHQKLKAIITSRIVGYDDSAFEEAKMLKLMINNFEDNQVEEYIKNWYIAEEEDEQIRNKEIHDFLSKKKLIDNELISNPLLLSLIVILYRNNLKVPESKLEIYQSCTKTLVDKWDQSKGMEINISEDLYRRKDTVFADLAYWQYKELSTKNGKVTYQRAKNTVARSLNEKLKITDDFTSDLFAEQFLLYAQKRSLYFDNNFTHKTFLEYFTAFWIFSNIEKKHKKVERDELIKEYIVSPYWHIVLELLINLIDKDQADNEIIDELIKNQLKINNNSSTFFLQIFSTIQNVSITTFEEVVKTSISGLLKEDEENRQNDHLRNQMNSPFYLLSQHYKNNLYSESIEKCIIDLNEEFNNLNDTILLGSLFLELIHENQIFKNKKRNKSKEAVYESIVKTNKVIDPLLFVMKEFTFNHENFDNNPIPFTAQFISSFNKDLFNNKINSRFSNFMYFPIQYICLNRALFSTDKNILNEFVSIMDSYEITANDLFICFLKQPFFLEEEEKIEIIIKNINNLKNNDYLILFVAIIYKYRFGNVYHSKQEHVMSKDNFLIHKLKNRKFAKKIEFIVNIDNNKSKVKSYIVQNFKVDKSVLN